VWEGFFMKKLSEIKSLLELHKGDIKDKYNIKRIGIFGSVARGEADELSDIDILVEFDKPIGLDFVLLADEIENILGVKIDLVTENAIKPKMFEFIKQDLIYV
jgi:predicted nucleotidyltransferase